MTVRVRRKKITHLLITTTLLLVAAVLIYALTWGLQLDQSKPMAVLIGKPAPTMTLHWLQGAELLQDLHAGRLSALAQGKVLVVNFWASWCFSCRQEAHLLQSLWEKEKQRVLVIGVAVHDEEDAARRFARQYRKTYPLGLDSNGNAAIDYGVTGVPETYVIDAQGVLRLRSVGELSAEFLQQVHEFL